MLSARRDENVTGQRTVLRHAVGTVNAASVVPVPCMIILCDIILRRGIRERAERGNVGRHAERIIPYAGITIRRCLGFAGTLPISRENAWGRAVKCPGFRVPVV